MRTRTRLRMTRSCTLSMNDWHCRGQSPRTSPSRYVIVRWHVCNVVGTPEKGFVYLSVTTPIGSHARSCLLHVIRLRYWIVFFSFSLFFLIFSVDYAKHTGRDKSNLLTGHCMEWSHCAGGFPRFSVEYFAADASRVSTRLRARPKLTRVSSSICTRVMATHLFPSSFYHTLEKSLESLRFFRRTDIDTRRLANACF